MFSTVIVGRAGWTASSSAYRRCGAKLPMPLRAKILPRAALSTARQMSAQSPEDFFRELPGDEPADVVFSTIYGLRTIELNRPAKLNSLNASMIRKIAPRLLEWQKSDMANVVVMKGAGDKAFCAGGDVFALAQAIQEGPEGQRRSIDYFALEYTLDHLIATYRKPYIAFMDGITMGGGVGLSIHAPLRIATERTIFAMPETTIGFFPDVGASFFLPRMAGAIGTYLALTSERLSGANVFYSGIATHYIHSTTLPNLEARLAELRFKDYDSMEDRLAVISATIEEFGTGLPHNEPMLLVGELRKAIDRCFGHAQVQQILASLQAEARSENGPVKAWAEQTLQTLHQRSPTSVHVTLREMQLGKNWSISQAFERELQIAAKFTQRHDFVEGVTAQLGKPRRAPTWQPAALEDISPEDEISEPFFDLSEDVPTLPLVAGANYLQYPYRQFGLPTEQEIEHFVAEGNKSRRDVVEYFSNSRKSKVGVSRVVKEVLSRKTTADQDGKLLWQK